MKKQTKSNRQKQIVFAAIAAVIFLSIANLSVIAQDSLQFNRFYKCPRYLHNFKVLKSANDKNYLVEFV